MLSTLNSPARRPRRVAAVVAFLVAAFSFAARPCSADVIRLRTGETIKGKALGPPRSNPQVLVVEDYLSCVVREFSWDAIEPDDAHVLQERFGIVFTNVTVIPCVVV